MNKVKTKAYIMELSVELFIETSQSLKHKRGVVKGVVEKLRNNFNVSVAEVGYLDSWQRSVLGIVMISNDAKILQKQAHAIENSIIEYKDMEILNLHCKLI